jgi:hypothetical protein
MELTKDTAIKYDGRFLVFNRDTQKLSLSKDRRDTKTYLTVGMVWAGYVAGKPITYWLEQIRHNSAKEG